ncbi:MAG: tRNA-intron lyase [Candidatus Pacearchaeota archaeon]
MIKVEKKGKLFITIDKNAFQLYSRSFFGDKKDNFIIYTPQEVLYLLKKNKINLFEKNKKISFNQLLKKLNEKEIDCYIVFEDLRNRGYILKSGLKFGGDFIIYDKGKKPNKDHSDWVLVIFKRDKNINIKDFVSKIRVATSTNKKLLIALVEEKKIVYYEVKWKKM